MGEGEGEVMDQGLKIEEVCEDARSYKETRKEQGMEGIKREREKERKKEQKNGEVDDVVKFCSVLFVGR